MLSLRYFLFVTLLTSCVYPGCGQENGEIDIKDGINAKLTNVRCECLDPAFCKFNQCILKAVSRVRTENFVNMTVLHRPNRDVKLMVEFFRKYSTYQGFPINITVDICKFLENPAKHPVFNNMYKYVKHTSNLNHTCPFDDEYVIFRKFALPYNPYFNFLPAGSYKVNTRYIIHKKLRWMITYWFDHRNPSNTFLS